MLAPAGIFQTGNLRIGLSLYRAGRCDVACGMIQGSPYHISIHKTETIELQV